MKKRCSAEQLVGLLRQADVAIGKGMNVPDVCRRLGGQPADMLSVADRAPPAWWPLRCDRPCRIFPCPRSRDSYRSHSRRDRTATNMC
jgi:hypothetical protein